MSSVTAPPHVSASPSQERYPHLDLQQTGRGVQSPSALAFQRRCGQGAAVACNGRPAHSAARQDRVAGTTVPTSGCKSQAEGVTRAETGRGGCWSTRATTPEQRRWRDKARPACCSSTPGYAAPKWFALRTTFASWASPLWQASRRILVGITCSGAPNLTGAPLQGTARGACCLYEICCRTRTGRPASPRVYRRKRRGDTAGPVRPHYRSA